MGYKHFTVDPLSSGVVRVSFDHASRNANIIDHQVLEELDALLDELRAASPAGVVLTSRRANFCMGADVGEFASMKAGPDQAYDKIRFGQMVFSKIARMPCPTAAAIKGFCLGGGLEMALACRFRLVEHGNTRRIGLPEVRLGIHPGYGGTVRLPKLVGDMPALTMMLQGRIITAVQAQSIGLAHAVPTYLLLQASCAVIANPHLYTTKKTILTLPHIPLLRKAAAALVGRGLRHISTDHYPAPHALLKLWSIQSGNVTAALEQEAKSDAQLFASASSRGLVRTFMLREKLRKPPMTEKASLPVIEKRREISTVHIIGGGIMGGDIAAWCASHGYKTTLQDINMDTLAAAKARFFKVLRRNDPRRWRITGDNFILDPTGLAIPRADLVIEAVSENPDLKKSIYRQIEPKMKEDAILATNTSSIVLESLTEALANPSRLLGLHFFNPVAKMQLVEVILGQDNPAGTLSSIHHFVRKLAKFPITVLSSPGFLVNRVLMPYLLEAARLVEEKNSVSVVDESAKRFGMPMGPLEVSDRVGLDICLSVANIIVKSKQGSGEIPASLLDRVKGGNYGAKSGKGFYEWKNKSLKPPPKNSETANGPQVQDRLVFSLLNEAVACLHEGVVKDAESLDAGMIFGAGFAPFRGGPIHYIQSLGAKTLKQKLVGLHAKFGKRFTPNPGWDNLHSAAEKHNAP